MIRIQLISQRATIINSSNRGKLVDNQHSLFPRDYFYNTKYNITQTDRNILYVVIGPLLFKNCQFSGSPYINQSSKRQA